MLTLLLSSLVCVAPAGEVPSTLIQVAPAPPTEKVLVRSPGHERAVVLIHGLTRFPREVRTPLCEPHDWQSTRSLLVQSLAREADVFAFCYGQHTTLTDVVERSILMAQLGRLRDLGYREIVLIGHSAGGLIARQLVEDHPDSPVTRVIQVATPTLGSTWAMFQWPGSGQNTFQQNLTRWFRRQTLSQRADVRLPVRIEFVSVVANGILHQGDGVVIASSQWTEDLARQGVPAYEVHSHHRGAVRDAEAVALLTALATTPQRRWTPAEVEVARRKILR